MRRCTAITGKADIAFDLNIPRYARPIDRTEVFLDVQFEGWQLCLRRCTAITVKADIAFDLNIHRYARPIDRTGVFFGCAV